jgi:hypothetical protein
MFRHCCNYDLTNRPSDGISSIEEGTKMPMKKKKKKNTKRGGRK